MSGMQSNEVEATRKRKRALLIEVAPLFWTGR